MHMIKTLLKSVREYKRTSILTPLFMVLEVVMEVIIPLITARLVDYGINGNNGVGNMNSILIYGGITVLMCGISLFGGAMSGRFGAISSAGFAKNLRHDMFYKVQNYSFYNIDRFSTASIVTRLTTDVTNVQNAYQMMLRIAVRSPLMLVFSLIMTIFINPRLSMVFLAVVPILVVGLVLIIKNAGVIFRRVFKRYDKLNSVVQENLHGVRVVKSFVREEHEIDKFNNISGDIYNDFVKVEKLLAFNGPLMQFCVYTATLLIAWFGATMIVNSGGTELSTGELMSLITYTMQILMNFMMLSMVFVMITMAKASADRIVELLEEQSDIQSPENPVTTVADGSVEFKDVVFSYSKNSKNRCLKDVNLKIHSGETIGIIGGTGSSKSSLVQLIPRLYDVTEGSVLVGGVDVRQYDIESLREQVAMVLQKNVLFSGTIKENLRWGNKNATDEQLVHACQLAQADGFIREFPDGYDTYIEQGGTNVSGGQKQRLCIARALLKNPKILILDDSTSAVDTKTDRMICDAFRTDMPDTTKFIIAQRISSVEHADRIIVMDAGGINAVGTHEELIQSNEIYREVYSSQQKGGIRDDA